MLLQRWREPSRNHMFTLLSFPNSSLSCSRHVHLFFLLSFLANSWDLLTILHLLFAVHDLDLVTPPAHTQDGLEPLAASFYPAGPGLRNPRPHASFCSRLSAVASHAPQASATPASQLSRSAAARLVVGKACTPPAAAMRPSCIAPRRTRTGIDTACCYSAKTSSTTVFNCFPRLCKLPCPT